MIAGRFRLFPRRMGQDIRAWPMLALLLLVVLVGIGCVLWFMREAMENERFAVRQKLAEAYRGQLALLQRQLEEQWVRGLASFDEGEPGAPAFARAMREGWANGAIFFDSAGQMVYPQTGGPARLAAANEELLAVENEPQKPALIERLRARLADYQSDPMSAAQRRFLMRELQRLAPGTAFPTLAGEDFTARYLEAQTAPRLPDGARQSDLPGVWETSSPGRRALVLFSTAGLKAKLRALVQELVLPAGVQVTVMAPGEDAPMDSTLATSVLAPRLPGWKLGLSLDDRTLFDAADRRVATHLWIGSAVVAGMTVLAIFLALGFRRQMQLARLKNDLVTTVSHELKTPLTAMRALVETLLEADQFDETTTREYLQLLARENARLSRLIENFLTFSRLERGKFAFSFDRIHPGAIAEAAIAAMGERRRGIAIHTPADLPQIAGDYDALVTALLNLLDNAWKYSGDEKRIALRTEANGRGVRFAVEDQGIGLTRTQCRQAFDRFYQADERLSRTAEGCGLGLSIVQSIVRAHGGSVRVTSEPGCGSTFTIEIPAVP